MKRYAPPRRMAIYIIAMGPNGPCKIGISRDPEQRLSDLQTAAPHKLTLEYVAWMRQRSQARRAEAMLHDAYRNDALEGEWFARTPDDLLSQIPSDLDASGFPS